ncbi:MAG: hypothetical protein NWR96_01490 [Crocinitomicaceae bacterium]|jgi:hypothetical protein|nr:hypothetical protein [Crocinitomicaceae bacterium]MDP4760279.1 hypothetical protein [Crocinitomicaceae bacterium]
MNRLKSKKVPLFILVIIAVIVLVVTMNRNSQKPTKPEQGKVKPRPTIEQISTDFSQNTFTDGNELSLLKELKICDTSILDGQMGSCSPRFFRFFKLNDAVSMKNAFLILVNGAAFPNDPTNFKSRRILIFEREKGQLVMSNTIKGNLIERRKNGPSSYDDLLIRFRLDEFDEAYHCLFKWKNGRYEYDRCEELYSFYCKGKVKPELIDSVSLEVKKILHDEKLLY